MFKTIKQVKYMTSLLPQLWGRMANHERRLDSIEDRLAALEKKKAK